MFPDTKQFLLKHLHFKFIPKKYLSRIFSIKYVRSKLGVSLTLRRAQVFSFLANAPRNLNFNHHNHLDQIYPLPNLRL
jgi:hypothetical protein